MSEKASDLLIPLQEIPSLGLTLDLGHAQLLTDENTSYEFIKKYAKRIRHIHIHDNRGGNSHLDDLHLPPGEGVIEFQRIFKHLLRAGYSRTVTLELKPREIERCLTTVKGWILNYNDKNVQHSTSNFEF
jgi:sugar phosphate isomerase/epimerase